MKVTHLASLAFVGASALAVPTAASYSYDLSTLESEYLLGYESTNYSPAENQLIDTFIGELNSIYSYNGTNSTDCARCVQKLELGKSIAMLRPDLVYPVFTRYCVESGENEVTCNITYSRNTVADGTSGSNFANMLYLMDPAGYDGQLYCFYVDSACPLPDTPAIDLSDMWPAKDEKHSMEPEPSGETYNVLHLSDFHLQTDFQIGAENNCSAYMCCTSHSTASQAPPSGYNFTEAMNFTSEEIANFSLYNVWYDENFSYVKGDEVEGVLGNDSVWMPAFPFGHYGCDSPKVLINNSLLAVAKFQEQLGLDFEFSIFTGDLVDHDEAAYIDYNKTIASEEILFRDVKNILQGVPMFPVLGNHDTFPYGQLAQKSSGFSNLFEWNAELMSDLWESYEWLNASTARYARDHYTGFAVDTTTGLRIIALNSNVYYHANLYNYWNSTNVDNSGQLQFLIDELLDAEAKDQRVWIIAHIPFVQEALPVQAEAYRQVLERFSPYTIAGTFFGHTHADQFNVLYEGGNKTEENALQVAWISQAITPLIENNPSWRYYTVDKKTHGIIDSKNYYLKLNETWTNDGEEPEWVFEYTPREAYPVEWEESDPLNATYWHRVAELMSSNDTVMTEYLGNMKRWSPYMSECLAGEDSQCLYTPCYVQSYTIGDYAQCLLEQGVVFSMSF